MLAAVRDSGDVGYLPSQMLNETKAFVDARRFIKGEQAQWLAEK